MKISNKINKKIVYLTVAFLLPFSLIALILAIRGIWWGSTTTILASDAFHQYVIFNRVLGNTLQGNGSLFYTFTSGLGLNFYALFSYYLGSFLTPFFVFFDLQGMPDGLYLFTLIKFGLTGLSTYFSLTSIHKKLNSYLALLLSSSLALMSFSTSQLEISNWLDTFILVPIILLGLHNLVNKKGRILYFASLTCLFIQNYYFGYMTAIFLIFFFLIEVSKHFKKNISSLLDFTVVSLLAGLSSMVMLLPTYLDLKTHGEKFTEINKLQTDHSWYLDLFAKNLVGNYDTTKFDAIPMIFVGLLPLILALVFFTVRSIKWPVKLAYAGALCFIIASFYLQPLDLLWQGMHAPNMFLHRYAWTFSFLIIYMAAETLVYLRNMKFYPLLGVFTFLTLGFGATFYFKSHYPFLSTISFILSLEFLIAYLVLLTAFTKRKISFQLVTLFSLLFSLIEITLHSYYQVEGLANEWNFPSRSSYEKQFDDLEELTAYSDKVTPTFFRTERLSPQTGNDSMKYGYNGISQFSSIRNRSSSSVLDKLGFRSDGTNLNLRYQNNTIIADSLFGVKYNLSETNPQKFGFSAVKNGTEVNLFENHYASQLAILTEGTYKDVPFTNLTLDNQTNFLNALSGQSLHYFYTLFPISSENALEFDNHVTVNALENTDTASVNYTLFIPKDSQVYVNLPNLHFSNDSSKLVQITVNNHSLHFTLDNTFSIFNLGYFSENAEQKISIHFPKNSQVSFNKPQFYRLDLVAYQTAMDTINRKEISVTTKGNQVLTKYTAQKDGSILFTLPYDKGWSAKKNGTAIPIKRAQNGFMKIDITKGSGTIEMIFVPEGIKIGTICSISGILLFILYDILKKRKKNRLAL